MDVTLTITSHGIGVDDKDQVVETRTTSAGHVPRVLDAMVMRATGPKSSFAADDVSLLARRTDIERWTVEQGNVRWVLQSWNRSGSLIIEISGVPDPPAEHPVGLVEIAERLGVARNTVDAWGYRGVLPEPRWTVGGRPAWDWRLDIVPWARETGRLDP